MAEPSIDWHLGQRIQSVDNFRGTVRYYGDVEGASPGSGWIGVEWDSEGRGKHDGCYKEKRYFSCSPGKGSFVRPNVLLQSISFEEAFVKKYASDDAASAEETMSFREAGKSKAAVRCELVGKERELKRTSNLKSLREVTLPCALISTPGDAEWLKENAVGIVSLELEDNLVSNWETVASITVNLPILESLALSGNRLEQILDVPKNDCFALAFQNLKRLVLNSTGVDFAQVNRFKKFIPNLTDLHLACNKLTTVVPPGMSDDFFHGWPALIVIDLSDNQLSSWEDILPLSNLSNLQRLILNNNSIREILDVVGPCPSSANYFSALTTLAIAHNHLQTWSSVVNLRHYPSLSEIRVQGNPLCAQLSASVARQLLIATLPSVTTVNGGEVRPRERVEAEKFYIRHTATRIGGAVKLPEEASRDQVLAELLARHGPPDESAGGSGSVAAGGGPSSMVEVTLRSMAAASSHKEPVTRRLPASVTVANVKRLCQQLFGLDMSRQRLFFQPGGGGGDAWSAEPLDDDLKPVSYYLGGGTTALVLLQEADEALAREEDERRTAAVEEASRRAAAEQRQLSEQESLGQARQELLQAAKRAAAAAAAAGSSL